MAGHYWGRGDGAPASLSPQWTWPSWSGDPLHSVGDQGRRPGAEKPSQATRFNRAVQKAPGHPVPRAEPKGTVQCWAGTDGLPPRPACCPGMADSAAKGWCELSAPGKGRARLARSCGGRRGWPSARSRCVLSDVSHGQWLPSHREEVPHTPGSLPCAWLTAGEVGSGRESPDAGWATRPVPSLVRGCDAGQRCPGCSSPRWLSAFLGGPWVLGWGHSCVHLEVGVADAPRTSQWATAVRASAPGHVVKGTGRGGLCIPL